MSALLIVLASNVLFLLLVASTLWLAARLFNYPARSLARALGVATMICLLSPTLALPLLFLPPNKKVLYSLLALAIQVLLTWWLIKRFHRTTTGRAWAGFGFYASAFLLYLTLVIFIIRPFLVQAYFVPTFAMAPTILSEHRVLKCPFCGGPLLVDIPDPRLHVSPTRNGICSACLRHTDVPISSLTGPVLVADRILVAKFLSPRRWDIVAFREKTHGDIYLKRIVAFPDETIAIDNSGRVIINGALVVPPPGHPALNFPWPDLSLSGEHVLSPETSLRMAPDECFVLGDNSTQSVDSRFFGPIHVADIVGVTSMIYWPPSRIRIIR